MELDLDNMKETLWTEFQEVAKYNAGRRAAYQKNDQLYYSAEAIQSLCNISDSLVKIEAEERAQGKINASFKPLPSASSNKPYDR